MRQEKDDLRLIFMGTPEFARISLQALVESGYHVCAVYTQPPRPRDRGHKVQPSPVHAWAEGRGIPVETPEKLRGDAVLERLSSYQADVIVVAAYGLILPQTVLDMPRLGCVNVHGSLLPRWRGAAPCQRAIEAGDKEFGVTLMQMDAGLDTGPMLALRSWDLDETVDAAQLMERTAREGAALLCEKLLAYARGEIKSRPQPAVGVTYAEKLKKDEACIDWHEPADMIMRKFRAFIPWPGLFFMHNGAHVKVRSFKTNFSERSSRYENAEEIAQSLDRVEKGNASIGRCKKPGTLSEGGCVICGAGTHLDVGEVVPAGEKSIDFIMWQKRVGLKAGDAL